MSKTIKSHNVEIQLRCKAFSGEGVRLHALSVDATGEVRVYDSVAGHYTRCHSLSERTVAKARKLAQTAA